MAPESSPRFGLISRNGLRPEPHVWGKISIRSRHAGEDGYEIHGPARGQIDAWRKHAPGSCTIEIFAHAAHDCRTGFHGSGRLVILWLALCLGGNPNKCLLKRQQNVCRALFRFTRAWCVVSDGLVFVRPARPVCPGTAAKRNVSTHTWRAGVHVYAEQATAARSSGQPPKPRGEKSVHGHHTLDWERAEGAVRLHDPADRDLIRSNGIRRKVIAFRAKRAHDSESLLP